MKSLSKRPVIILLAGTLIGAAVIWTLPEQSLKASSAGGNDKFSMVTVPVTGNLDSEAVFILDHLTGILRGGHISGGNGFDTIYTYNVAGDFQVNPATPEPKYVMVSGTAQMRSTGGAQPANGALYIGELTSGMVVAYGYSRPNRGGPGGVQKIGFFPFRESIGQ